MSRKIWRYKISEVDAALASGVRRPHIPAEDSALAQRSTKRRIPARQSPQSREEIQWLRGG